LAGQGAPLGRPIALVGGKAQAARTGEAARARLRLLVVDAEALLKTPPLYDCAAVRHLRRYVAILQDDIGHDPALIAHICAALVELIAIARGAAEKAGDTHSARPAPRREVLAVIEASSSDRLTPPARIAPRHLRHETGSPLTGRVLALRPEKPRLPQLAAAHLHDLVTLSLGATRNAAQHAPGAARLLAIKVSIAQNIDRPELTVGAIAEQHRVSSRYVQKLFRTEGTTFSQFLRDQRLHRAYHLLSDLRSIDRTIAAIAFDVGFNDLSYFNRTFRRRFGATPSDVRALAQRKAFRCFGDTPPEVRTQADRLSPGLLKYLRWQGAEPMFPCRDPVARPCLGYG